jgi:hypothetical protein
MEYQRGAESSFGSTYRMKCFFMSTISVLTKGLYLTFNYLLQVNP